MLWVLVALSSDGSRFSQTRGLSKEKALIWPVWVIIGNRRRPLLLKSSKVWYWRIQGDARDTRPYLGAISFIFMQFSAKIVPPVRDKICYNFMLFFKNKLQNPMMVPSLGRLAPPALQRILDPGSWRPLPGEILDPPLLTSNFWRWTLKNMR